MKGKRVKIVFTDEYGTDYLECGHKKEAPRDRATWIRRLAMKVNRERPHARCWRCVSVVQRIRDEDWRTNPESLSRLREGGRLRY